MKNRPEEVIGQLRENKRLKQQLEDEEIELAMEIAKEKMFYKLKCERNESPLHDVVKPRYYTKESLAIQMGQSFYSFDFYYKPIITPVGPSDLRTLAEDDVKLDDMSPFERRTILIIRRKHAFVTHFLVPDGVDADELLREANKFVVRSTYVHLHLEKKYICSDNAVGSMEDILTRIKNIIK